MTFDWFGHGGVGEVYITRSLAPPYSLHTVLLKVESCNDLTCVRREHQAQYKRVRQALNKRAAKLDPTQQNVMRALGSGGCSGRGR
jgi:hypothetical protein